MKLRPLAFAITSIIATSSYAADELDTVMVNADFRATSIEETTSSVSVIDSVEINKRSAQHVEKVLNAAPNVNFSAGASRGQYFQIRGIGERSQFQTPINPSVGLTVDGIDYSRTGAAASLLDTKQIEILRGPQGTRFGANALAGMILIESNDPTKETEGYIEQTAGSRNTYTTTGVVSGTLVEDKLLGRLALQKHVTDGYMKNTYLNRDDTNNLDEITGKAKLRWLASDDLTLDFTAIHIDKDNGYDAFTLDNSFNTESDTPGEDVLKSTAYGINAKWDVNSKVRMEASASTSSSDIDYNYDLDWVYQDKFADLAITNNCSDDDPTGACPYNGAEQFLRERDNDTIDIRFLSSENGRIFNNTTDWVVGIYQNDQNENTTASYIDQDFDAIYSTGSEFSTRNRALYSQLDIHASEKLTYTLGLRAEKYESDYQDTNGKENAFDETLYGGKLGIAYAYNASQKVYGSLARSFKTGGINNDPRPELTEDKRNFDTEYLWNLETGLKSSLLNGDLKTRLAVFYSKRINPQVSTSIELEPGKFLIYTDNVDQGYNYGLEAEADWSVNNAWRLYGNLGLLQSGLSEYTSTTYTIEEGRDQAHAPNYQLMVGAEHYVNNNWVISANVEGKDGFYYSDSHNAKSSAYALINTSAEFSDKNLTITFWARNLLDREYDVRGFLFGNNPADDYTTTNYTQKGEPRTVGVTARYNF